MIGFQCSTTITQPCLGRTIFPTTGPHPNVSANVGVAAFHQNRGPMSPNLIDYFPLNGDGLRLNWAHAVNSRSKLIQAISGDDLMIEADVSLAETSRYPVPIMAHPPNNTSDLTLEDFLIEIVRSNCAKGIKLDFKSTRVVEPAFRVLARHSDFIKGPIVLNADILTGPNNPSTTSVDAWTFLMLCRTRFPKAIISIGWTTNLSECQIKTGYTREMIDHMASLVREYNLMQPLTFPVNATLLKYSICEIQRLLFQVPNSTLTVWAHPEEFANNNLTLHDLLIIRKAFSINSVFYDMPSEVINELRRASNL
ncbi:hypothetical protein RDWZM_003902 [Blomia tropicalis]|uniref:Menorin-like domain-containing protein n=1 Tax=Blomia tropicalis TaxID=40697 RepID=A0A9Q0MJ79_BLOTA|nr:hypothetical protein BLOT_002413 [Blomia tropicalis]KAJ6225357.1 hypothetical protein RDWZM_003902 [Blomia tropicalis]